MRLPDFLIIGAMKAGTTTLYRDLLTNPGLFLSPEKERSHLLRDDVLTEAGRRDYASLFRRARPDQRCGIAPTRYTTLPDCPGVPQRALKVHGASLRAIYLVREPVARTVSHHYHELAAGTVTGTIDEAVRREPRFIDYSRYAMQVAPWLETFGPRQVLIVRFETYVADRRATVARICRFIGVEPRDDLIQPDVAYNRSDDKPVPHGVGGALRRSPLYRRLVRPLLPHSVKDRLREAFLPRAPARPPPPSPETVEYILEALGDDPDRLRSLMGSDDPLWDVSEVRRRYAARSGVAGAAGGTVP